MKNNRVIAEFISAVKPTEEEIAKLSVFLEKKLGVIPEIVWVKDESVKKGFVLKAANEVYDNTPEG